MRSCIEFGGVYVDLDYKDVKPLNELHHTYDFYACLNPLESKALVVGNGIMGAAVHHPILRECVVNMHPELSALISEKALKGWSFPIFAGFHFTRSILKIIEECPGTNIVFPPTFFSPNPDRVPKEAYTVHYWHASWLNSAPVK